MPNAQHEMTMKKRPQDVRHPAFVVRAPDPSNRGRWITLGYAWSRKNGEEGYTIKLNPLDGVYYCDIRPNMRTEPILRDHIKTFDHFLFGDIWALLNRAAIPAAVEPGEAGNAK